MFAIKACLDELLTSLPPYPASKADLASSVNEALTKSTELQSSSDNRRSQWEYLLKDEVLRLADTEASFEDKPDDAYYDMLCSRLDIILVFTEHDACDATFIFTVLQDLLETQTVSSCSHIFSWIEKHSSRLTEGMVPQKGKALVLLRTLNDLLRRLSKTGSTTSFCGRILTFLSAVFPLGERSGVNLRGEYGPQWDGVSYRSNAIGDKMDVDKVDKSITEKMEGMQIEANQVNKEGGGQNDSQTVKAKSMSDSTEDEKKEEFYNTFWSLQLPFSRPPLFSHPETLESFKSAVNAVIPVIKEATTKERAMMGSKAVVGNLKRKRDPAPVTLDDANRGYFFAKFLTSPELLDLEIADTSFRRQFLFQLLILLTHLLQFTKTEKANWATPRNRSLQMDFILQPDDAKWVEETKAKAFEELRQTTPNGRAFADTVQTILERERNWVRWKNDLCSPFDKESLPETLEESTAPLRGKMREEMEEYKYKFGSESLTEIWEMGYRGLHDLQMPFIPGDVKDFVKDVEKENTRIELRKRQLEKQAQKLQEARARSAVLATPAVPTPTTVAPAPSSQGQTPAIVAPVPQRSAPPTAASPPLHPSLPAKPGTQPVAPPTPVQPVVQPSPVPAPVHVNPVVVQPPELSDPLIIKAEETKQRLAWLALRTARDGHLHHFGRIGNGDIILLAQEIEKEKEIFARGGSQPIMTDGSVGTGSEHEGIPSVLQAVSADDDDGTSNPTTRTEMKVETPADIVMDKPVSINNDAQVLDSNATASESKSGALDEKMPVDS